MMTIVDLKHVVIVSNCVVVTSNCLDNYLTNVDTDFMKLENCVDFVELNGVHY